MVDGLSAAVGINTRACLHCPWEHFKCCDSLVVESLGLPKMASQLSPTESSNMGYMRQATCK